MTAKGCPRSAHDVGPTWMSANIVRLHDTQGVTGSSPVRPTIRAPGQRVFWPGARLMGTPRGSPARRAGTGRTGRATSSADRRRRSRRSRHLPPRDGRHSELVVHLAARPSPVDDSGHAATPDRNARRRDETCGLPDSRPAAEVVRSERSRSVATRPRASALRRPAVVSEGRAHRASPPMGRPPQSSGRGGTRKRAGRSRRRRRR